MPALHTILEVRTGRDAQHTPETAAQIFATLPKLRDDLWNILLKKEERISFELIVELEKPLKLFSSGTNFSLVPIGQEINQSQSRK